jgi:hypothetical protein
MSIILMTLDMSACVNSSRATRFCVVLGAVVLAGCATVSDTVISDSTAPRSVTTSNASTITGEHEITVISDEIRSTNPDDLYDVAIARAEKRCPTFDVSRTDEGVGASIDGRHNPRARWLTLHIRCLTVAREKIKALGAIVVESESERIADAFAFDTHSETFRGSYDAVFDAVLRVLKSQGDPVYRTDRDKGVIVTGRARHGAIGFPRYEQYVIALDVASEATTTVTFKLLIHVPNLRSDLDQVSSAVARPMTFIVAKRRFVYQRAAAFVDQLKKQVGSKS